MCQTVLDWGRGEGKGLVADLACLTVAINSEDRALLSVDSMYMYFALKLRRPLPCVYIAPPRIHLKHLKLAQKPGVQRPS